MQRKRKNECKLLNRQKIYDIQHMSGDERRVCGNCSNFRLHYVESTVNNFSPLQYGHCRRPGFKQAFVLDEACLYWQAKE